MINWLNPKDLKDSQRQRPRSSALQDPASVRFFGGVGDDARNSGAGYDPAPTLLSVLLLQLAEEITIAGNLKDMLQNIEMIGSDLERIGDLAVNIAEKVEIPVPARGEHKTMVVVGRKTYDKTGILPGRYHFVRVKTASSLLIVILLVIVISVKTADDDIRTMKMTFAHTGENRALEAEEWIHLIAHSSPLDIRKASFISPETRALSDTMIIPLSEIFR
jgi:hypothetical protein